jgi:hypothetical protein
VRGADNLATLKCRLYRNSGGLRRLELSGSVQACTWIGLTLSIIWRAYVLVRKREWKRPLGRPRRKCKNNIKIDLQEVEWMSIDWINLAQNRKRSRLIWRGGTFILFVFSWWYCPSHRWSVWYICKTKLAEKFRRTPTATYPSVNVHHEWCELFWDWTWSSAVRRRAH